MNKFKKVCHKLKTDFMEIFYGISSFDRRMRKDAILLFVGMFIIFGAGGWMHQQSVRQQAQQQAQRLNKFTDVKESPTAGMKHIERLKDAHSRFTVVLVGSKCKDCHHIAKQLNHKIKQERKNGPIVVLDLDQFNNQQLNQLSHLLPSLKDHGSFYMPTVARYGYANHQTELIRMSTSTKYQELVPIFTAKPASEMLPTTK